MKGNLDWNGKELPTPCSQRDCSIPKKKKKSLILIDLKGWLMKANTFQDFFHWNKLNWENLTFNFCFFDFFWFKMIPFSMIWKLVWIGLRLSNMIIYFFFSGLEKSKKKAKEKITCDFLIFQTKLESIELSWIWYYQRYLLR